MSNVLPVEDLSKTYLEHAMVINNFVIKIGSQIKDSLCRVFGDGVQYEWRENDDKVMIPDVSIICNLRDRKNISFTGIPRFVMEVLSNATEEYDRHEKMNIYCKVGVSEYWIVDWRKKVRRNLSFLTSKRMEQDIRIFIKQLLHRIKRSYNW
ncbi:MAG: Uma2 family endonuclease [Hominisplanchenecus sp.]